MIRALSLLAAALCLVPDLPALGWHAVPGWVALVCGVALALTAGNPWPGRTRALTPRLLAVSVVGLGAAMDLRAVARVGLHGFGYTLVGISATLAMGALQRIHPRLVGARLALPVEHPHRHALELFEKDPPRPGTGERELLDLQDRVEVGLAGRRQP
jgi:hypothetical protein